MRKPVDAKTMDYLARRPAAMSKYIATGVAPSLAEPDSPLIRLLKSIPPKDRAHITALRITSDLGYTGVHQFHTAAQALNWLVPPQPSTHHPSQSHQIKGFKKVLTIDDLAASAIVPEDIAAQRWSPQVKYKANAYACHDSDEVSTLPTETESFDR
ncbi:hypothetical protein [Pseudomonas sp.]|uniref:hypothetical protein n=1 Tax=Pseudomonas sp. TaxID=306 RepID=UPI00289C1BC5|nr:hypothetical protein [Pseudomonas sp.]